MAKKDEKEEEYFGTVSDLIKKLQSYPPDTEICSGYHMKNGGMMHTDLTIEHSNPIGDRDRESDLLLWIGPKKEEEVRAMSPKEVWDILNQRPDEEHDSGEFHSPEL